MINKGLISKIYQQLILLNIKTFGKKWAENLNILFEIRHRNG